MTDTAPNLAGNPFDFSGKTALVVGGSSGIGNTTAQAFRRAGATVHVWGTQAAASDYGDSDMEGLHYAQVNVADRASLDAASLPETLDIAMLSQGVVKYDLAEYRRDAWDEVVDVNLTSLMDCARLMHPLLAATKGSLITVSSIAGYKATATNPAYGASKAAAIALTRALALAWARDGIRVNGIAPGFVRTKMTAQQFEDEKREAQTLRTIPLRRTGEQDEIADAAMFLASSMASYMIGQTLTVDGGLTLM
ncbi:3-oxoacyl-[acyl-carrier-protein] reductase [Alteripontixanthobacter maritimus]|uniref:3-oxoacyl-[acyl-carrier-protein] reductase n=1 Tax=Alteripontixanthobacter maritimus TaxID=2161824 RepID=A0A369QCH9_9SPHN|nr:SDR family oxidoreductase [Alteripontixanthobacter maritimus]RDC61275.1 3-oxoacyl-[acyl-carrier-protein] reductase [Alteripontixanthobacter maritimus]